MKRKINLLIYLVGLCLLGGCQTQAELETTVDFPESMTTADMVVVTVRVKLLGEVVLGDKGNYIDRVTLSKFEKTTGGPSMSPRHEISTVPNPDKQAREFTARFVITSPEPGLQHYGVRVGYPAKWTKFSIKVLPKVVFLGEEGKISITSGLPADIVDSESYLHRLEIYKCGARAKFGPYGETGVRWLTNRQELTGARGGQIGRKDNPDLRRKEVHAEFTVGPETEEKVVSYLIWYGYFPGCRYFDIINVHFQKKEEEGKP